MRRVCVVCEGQTEVEFIKSCVAPYLYTENYSIYPSIIQAPSGRHRGGRVTVERLVDFMRHQYHEADRITTFVDFYGFQDANGRTAAQLENDILTGLIARGKNINSHFVSPYVQLHEFEALLFSDIEKFEYVLDGWSNETRQALSAIRMQFSNPEKINNHPSTAPSKRILKTFPQGTYSKTEHGPIIAEEIGIDVIRRQCPGFNQWLDKLESWRI
ncbi:DUF4276 family protein [Kosakonia cowanii]|uniref:DUF4276 family protein n=1 Tax=Kosakonia cowanii TaxID=208223 RepID=UPI0027306A92|nr:DUF4276 family protein [Kosakonia cowanii]WKW41884.1 DUF4276 family protein [Kosakonia cowanii]